MIARAKAGFCRAFITKRRGGFIIAALAALFISVPMAGAHEFWLEPENFAPAAKARTSISIRLGQHFKGDSFPYIGSEFRRFAQVDASGERALRGTDGDDPALKLAFPSDGLAELIHESTFEKLNFETWEKFQAYLDLEGLNAIAGKHKAQGKPLANIREIYARCAKTLIWVGGAQGDDRLAGMTLEIVAEQNPYLLKQGDDMRVRLYYLGKPLADAQVTAIARADSMVRVNARTDGGGYAVIRLSHRGPWLLSAVHMIEPERGEKADWKSYWASLTFAVPCRAALLCTGAPSEEN